MGFVQNTKVMQPYVRKYISVSFITVIILAWNRVAYLDTPRICRLIQSTL